MSRVIIIGDVHGCFDEFSKLLEMVKYAQGTDTLISLGDLMDRGPKPAECVQLARSVGAKLVQSNHDDKHIRYRRYLVRKASDPSYKGHAPKLAGERIEQNSQLSEEDVHYLASAPDFLELPEFNFVAIHGGLRPGLPVQRTPHDEIIRCRWVRANGSMADAAYNAEGQIVQPADTQLWMERYDGNQNVVYGHAVHSLEHPRIDRRPNGVNCFGIDTGCAFGGHLTALILDTQAPASRQFVQVKAKQAYDVWYAREA